MFAVVPVLLNSLVKDLLSRVSLVCVPPLEFIIKVILRSLRMLL